MDENPPSPGPEAVRRAALLGLHLVCAGATAVALLRKGSLSMDFVLAGGRTRGIGVALVVVPVVLPYALSFAISKRVVPTRGAYAWFYAAVLVLATTGSIWYMTLTATVGDVLRTAVGLALVLAVVATIVNTYDHRNRAA